MKNFKTLFVLVMLLGMVSLCQAADEERGQNNPTLRPSMWEKSLNSSDLAVMEEIMEKYGLKEIDTNSPKCLLTKESAHEIVSRLPHVAKAIIEDNRLELSRFDEYRVGIPQEVNLAAEVKRLDAEATLLEKAFGNLPKTQ